MSEEQLKAFIAKAKDDTSIQEKLKAAKTPEDVVEIAKEHGHESLKTICRISATRSLKAWLGEIGIPKYPTIPVLVPKTGGCSPCYS